MYSYSAADRNDHNCVDATPLHTHAHTMLIAVEKQRQRQRRTHTDHIKRKRHQEIKSGTARDGVGANGLRVGHHAVQCSA